MATLPIHYKLKGKSDREEEGSTSQYSNQEETLLRKLGTILSQVCPKPVPSDEAALIMKNSANQGEVSISELMDWVGESNRTRFRQDYLKALMEEGFVEFTIPDKPTSSKQKYRLSKKGKELYKNAKNSI